MSQRAVRASKREIRKAFGPSAIEQLSDQEQAIRVICEVMTRGFLGRFRWLFTGK